MSLSNLWDWIVMDVRTGGLGLAVVMVVAITLWVMVMFFLSFRRFRP